MRLCESQRDSSIYGGPTFWWHLQVELPVSIDQYNNETLWCGYTTQQSFPLSFYPCALHNKVASISQPWQALQLCDRREERSMMDWCQSSGELYKLDSKQEHPICQQSQLTTVKMLAHSASWRKKKNLHCDAIFTMRKLYLYELDWPIHQQQWRVKLKFDI